MEETWYGPYEWCGLLEQAIWACSHTKWSFDNATEAEREFRERLKKSSVFEEMLEGAERWTNAAYAANEVEFFYEGTPNTDKQFGPEEWSDLLASICDACNNVYFFTECEEHIDYDETRAEDMLTWAEHDFLHMTDDCHKAVSKLLEAAENWQSSVK